MELNLSNYIKHPEKLDKDSLTRLAKLVDDYPYFQPARLLYLFNLYQLHDAAFDRELRRSAIFLPDRDALFHLIEGANYKVEPPRRHHPKSDSSGNPANADRTYSLIDSFLESLPEEKPHRAKPVDASTDYMAYLMQHEDVPDSMPAVPPMPHQELIDDFIGQATRRIVLPQPDSEENAVPLSLAPGGEAEEEDYFTETLAKIYIKQGRYAKAMEIIRRLSLKYPKKNRYFADQIRFLEKLIINNRNKKE